MSTAAGGGRRWVRSRRVGDPDHRQGVLHQALLGRGALPGRQDSVARRRDRRVVRHERRSEQLGPRTGRARRRTQAAPPGHAPELRRRAAVRDQRLCARPVGDRDERVDVDRRRLDPQVDRARHREDHRHAPAVRPDLQLPDLRLPTVPEAARRERRDRSVRVQRLRRGRRRGDERIAARLHARAFTPSTRRFGASDLEINIAAENDFTIAAAPACSATARRSGKRSA